MKQFKQLFHNISNTDESLMANPSNAELRLGNYIIHGNRDFGQESFAMSILSLYSLKNDVCIFTFEKTPLSNIFNPASNIYTIPSYGKFRLLELKLLEEIKLRQESNKTYSKIIFCFSKEQVVNLNTLIMDKGSFLNSLGIYIFIVKNKIQEIPSSYNEITMDSNNSFTLNLKKYKYKKISDDILLKLYLHLGAPFEGGLANSELLNLFIKKSQN